MSCKASGNRVHLQNAKHLHMDSAYIMESLFAFGLIVGYLLVLKCYFYSRRHHLPPPLTIGTLQRPEAQKTRQSFEHITFESIPRIGNSSPRVIISVDATPTRGGAIFKFPDKPFLFFYSIDWSEHYEFPWNQEPDKFEMLNGLIALHLFAKERAGWKLSGRTVLLQTDNTFPLAVSNLNSNDPFHRLRRSLDLMLEVLGGTVKQVLSKDNGDMVGADLLSRQKIDRYKESHDTDLYKFNISTMAQVSMTHVKPFIPEEYVK